MRELWRPLARATAIMVLVAAGEATAQTVTVVKAPAGATVELGLNADTIGTATADATGTASLPVNLPSHRGRAEADVRIFVDVCPKSRRVTLVESGWQPPAMTGACVRRELFGVFYLRDVTTLVVNTSEKSQAVWIKQGPAPPSWLSDEPTGASGKTGSAFLVPNGLILFGGGGIGIYANASSVSCGLGTECSSKDVRLAGRVGGEYWFTPFLAASFSYLKPASATTAGGGTGYHFDSSLKPHVVTVAGKVAYPVGRFRLYAEGGADYHWAKLTTVQTIDDKTITVDDVSQTVTGGTQAFLLETAGWGWMFGGGVEVWVKRSLGLYGEFGRAKLRGGASGAAEGTMDEGLTYMIVGARFRLAGRR